jgi:hypothetical protein
VTFKPLLLLQVTYRGWKTLWSEGKKFLLGNLLPRGKSFLDGTQKANLSPKKFIFLGLQSRAQKSCCTIDMGRPPA